MKPKIAAFPKCYLEQIAGHRSMSVFEWIEMARSLDADGLEMYEGFFTSLDDGYIDSVGAKGFDRRKDGPGRAAQRRRGFEPGKAPN